MSGISRPPFRLLMQMLGAGGCVSEFVSGHGIDHGNPKARGMLAVDPLERHTGIQLFGEDAEVLARAALRAQEHGPTFIDINMGCPVKKVVSKGAGSALLRETGKLGAFFATIRKALELPLTIKIRIGWDESSRNAREVIRIGASEGVASVAIHGRTRAQQYRGEADWDYMESLVAASPLPLVGNGDLYTPGIIARRLATTGLHALMIGRGALRNPFLFLEALAPPHTTVVFGPSDYLEVIGLFVELLHRGDSARGALISLKKHAVWLAHSLEGASGFRESVFKAQDIREILSLCESFFLSLDDRALSPKHALPPGAFMAGGHG